MKILQLNLNHCAAAQDLLKQTVLEENIDVALLSEQYTQRSESTWIKDISGKAAIWSCKGQAFTSCSRDAQNGFTWANIHGIYLVSCYARPSASINEFEHFLLQLSLMTRSKSPIIIAGDFNAWSTAWGSRSTNHRGRLVLEFLSQTNLTIINSGTQNTYQKGNKGSVIDLMFANDALSRHIKWVVSDIYTNSDHMAIIAEVLFPRETEPSVETPLENEVGDKRSSILTFSKASGGQQRHQATTPPTWYPLCKRN